MVTMQGFDFEPRRLRVDHETTVEWVNDAERPHTVTAYEDRIPDDADYFASGDYQPNCFGLLQQLGGINAFTGTRLYRHGPDCV